MLKKLDSWLESLLKNRIIAMIARKILLSRYIRRALERIYNFYAKVRYEEGIDPFLGGYFAHPRMPVPKDATFNTEVSEKNLVDIKRILDEAGIPFWLMFGTFLGAYRDKSLIPYDDDTDLAILDEDIAKIAECREAFNNAGFYLSLGHGMTTAYRYGQHTDMYRFKLEGDKRGWAFVRINDSAFETYQEVEFLGHNWRIFHEPERWLKYLYGDDWETPIRGKNVFGGQPHGEEFESELTSDN